MGVDATEEAIRAASNAGLAVIVSTHLLSLLVRVSGRICVMTEGKIVADEPASNFVGHNGEVYYEKLLRPVRDADMSKTLSAAIGSAPDAKRV